MKQSINSNSIDATQDLARKLGQSLHGAEVINLVGDIGAGKTTFTKGLVEGAGSADHVSSPTFTICNRYQSPKFTIYHCDFYRLENDKLIQKELEDMLDGQAVVVMEWAENIPTLADIETIDIKIVSDGDDSRTFEINGPEYFVQGVKK